MSYKGDVKAQRKRYKAKYPEKVNAAKKRYHEKLRLEIISHYSKGSMKCSKCGEGHIEFMEIAFTDITDRQHNKTGTELYGWIRTNNYPAGYQVLCSNCNTKRVKQLSEFMGTFGSPPQRKTFRQIRNLKLDIFSHYMTDGKIRCSCPGCNIEDIDMLCMDHVNGDGAQHRKEIGLGLSMYRWIRNNGYPDTFRILCYNCNQSLGLRNYCPHKNNNLPMVI